MPRPIAYIMTADIKNLDVTDLEDAIKHLDTSIKNLEEAKKPFEKELRERREASERS